MLHGIHGDEANSNAKKKYISIAPGNRKKWNKGKFAMCNFLFWNYIKTVIAANLITASPYPEKGKKFKFRAFADFVFDTRKRSFVN